MAAGAATIVRDSRWATLAVGPVDARGPGRRSFRSTRRQAGTDTGTAWVNGRTIADRLRASGDLAALAELFLTGRPAAELLLFIDQFEELFTLTAPAHHRRFIAMLARAAQSLPTAHGPDPVRDFITAASTPPIWPHSYVLAFPLAAPDLPALLEMIIVTGGGGRFDLPGRLSGPYPA